MIVIHEKRIKLKILRVLRRREGGIGGCRKIISIQHLLGTRGDKGSVWIIETDQIKQQPKGDTCSCKNDLGSPKSLAVPRRMQSKALRRWQRNWRTKSFVFIKCVREHRQLEQTDHEKDQEDIQESLYQINHTVFCAPGFHNSTYWTRWERVNALFSLLSETHIEIFSLTWIPPWCSLKLS